MWLSSGKPPFALRLLIFHHWNFSSRNKCPWQDLTQFGQLLGLPPQTWWWRLYRHTCCRVATGQNTSAHTGEATPLESACSHQTAPPPGKTSSTSSDTALPSALPETSWWTSQSGTAPKYPQLSAILSSSMSAPPAVPFASSSLTALPYQMLSAPLLLLALKFIITFTLSPVLGYTISTRNVWDNWEDGTFYSTALNQTKSKDDILYLQVSMLL